MKYYTEVKITSINTWMNPENTLQHQIAAYYIHYDTICKLLKNRYQILVLATNV